MFIKNGTFGRKYRNISLRPKVLVFLKVDADWIENSQPTSDLMSKKH